MNKSLFNLWISLCIFFQLHAFALDVQLFRPTSKNNETLSTPSSQSIPTGKIYVGLFGNYVVNPLEFGLVNGGSKVSDLVSRVATGNLILGTGILPGWDIEADLPLHIYKDVNTGSSGLQDQKSFTLGDLMLRSTITLKQRELRKEGTLGIALNPFVTLPLNQTGDFLNQKKFTVGGNVVLDQWVSSRNYFGFSSGFRGRKEKEQLLNLAVNHEILMSLSYIGKMSETYGVDFLADAKASTTTTKPFKQISTPVELDLALRKIWSSGLSWIIGAGRGLTNGYGAPDFRVFSGLIFQTPLHRHQTASTPASPVAKEEPKGKGMLVITVKDEAGTPVSAEIFVKTEIGKFSERNFASAWQKEVSAGNYQISVQSPEYLWSYREVVVTSENPTNVEIVLTSQKVGSKIEALGTIMFDVNKASLKSESYSALDHVTEVLKTNPGVKKISIDAHTDSQGSDAYNLDLSSRRAQTVYDYLVKQGIDANRLESKGYGETKPIDSNETPQGRSKNRRVEFVILESDSDAVKGSN